MRKVSFCAIFTIAVFQVMIFLHPNFLQGQDDHTKNSESQPGDESPAVQLGSNMDLFAGSRNFGPENAQRSFVLREVELSLEAQIKPWLYGMIFLTRPVEEAFEVEEAAVIADLPLGIKLKAGKYRNEFGLLNTIHEPERPQVSLPLPIIEFLGEEQLREPGVTLGKKFDFGRGHSAGISFAALNSENNIAFNNAQSRDKAYAGKFYYGYKSSAVAYQFGFSALTGKNDAAGRLATHLQTLDFRFLLQPDYVTDHDYPARFMLLGEIFYNQRELSIDRMNKARGYWAVADYQIIPAHHIGAGLEYTTGRLDNTLSSKASSIHYSWYYSSHGRLQVQMRRLDTEIVDSGLEVQLQWLIVLGPHRETPFLDILKSKQ
jgi:hypothetical protein